jgi:hypothetical protein
MKNLINKTKFSFLVVTLFLLPFIVSAQGGPTGLVYECYNNGVYGNCNYQDLINAVRNFTNQLTIYVLAFTVVPIAYAGFLFMTSGDNAGNRTKAKSMLYKVAIGIFFMLSAWLIVSLIANALLNPSFSGVNPIRP